MTERDRSAWPMAELDPIRRIHVMATGIPGLSISERVIPLPFEALWEAASDLERSLPSLSRTYVTSFRYTAMAVDRREAIVRGRLGLRDRFHIVLRPGWCWMEGRVLCAGMAAMPAGEGTAFAWAAGVRLPGGRVLRPVTRPVLDRTLLLLERHAIRVLEEAHRQAGE